MRASERGAGGGGRQGSSLTFVLAGGLAAVGIAFLVWQWTNNDDDASKNALEDDNSDRDLFVKAQELMESIPKQKKLTLDDLVIETVTEPFSSPAPAVTAMTKRVPSGPLLSSTAAPEQYAPHPSALPTTISRSCVILSIPTQYWIQLFADRVVLGISQLNGRVGNYLLCQAITSDVNPKDVDYQVTSLLGSREETLLSVYTERIARRTLAGKGANHSTIILGISLHKDQGKDPEMFRSIVDLLVQLYEEAVTVSATTS
jgi:Proteasome assembly chaperone 3